MMLVPGRMALAGLLVAAAAAGLAPLAQSGGASGQDHARAFPGWPTQHEGRPLSALPLSPREQAFANGFPGRIGRFHDGGRELIVRYVARPTRMLHPSGDCLRGIGYAITPLPTRMHADGSRSSCLRATRGKEALIVCESIRDDRGQTWSDVSAWYWDAVVRGARGPWWSIVVAEHD